MKLVGKASEEGRMVAHAERTVFFLGGAEGHFVCAAIEWWVAHGKLYIEASNSVDFI